MSKSVIHSGICGFTTKAVARTDSGTCSLIITSDCPADSGISRRIASGGSYGGNYVQMKGPIYSEAS